MITLTLAADLHLVSANALVIPSYLDTAAIMCGALTGAMLATRKGLDWLGVLVVAFCTGIGGGLIRDVLLENGIPVILLNPSYQLYATVGAVVGLFFAKGAAKFTPAYQALDTLMLGVWMLLGCSKAAEAGLQPIPVIFVGTVASIGGAILKDVLCHEVPSLVQRGHYYALAAFFAATVFVIVNSFAPMFVAQLVSLVVAMTLQIISNKFKIYSPTPFDMSDKVFRLSERWRQQMSARAERQSRDSDSPPSSLIDRR